MKGQYGQQCNRRVCTNPDAVYYNHSTQAYYCQACAIKINRENETEAMKLYGHDLCTLTPGYPTDRPCCICGERPAWIEPRFNYTICHKHDTLTPAQVVDTANARLRNENTILRRHVDDMQQMPEAPSDQRIQDALPGEQRFRL